jgi:AcrR family transcriptional regulator
MQGTRDRILDALEELVVDEGALAATLEATADRAGVSKGGLLYHFATKEALLEGLVERVSARFEGELERSLAAGASVVDFWVALPEPRDSALLRSLMAVLRVHGQAEGPLTEAVRDVVERWNARLRDELGGDPIRAELVRLVGDGLLFGELLGVEQPSAEVLEQIRSLLREGEAS